MVAGAREGLDRGDGCAAQQASDVGKRDIGCLRPRHLLKVAGGLPKWMAAQMDNGYVIESCRIYTITRRRRKQGKRKHMRKIGLIAALAMMLVAFSASAASAAITTTIDPAAAPTGTHLQTGTIGCSVDASGLVTCSAYELAGVGNANATGSLVTTYTATVTCTNNGGHLVPVQGSVQTAAATTGSLSPENGRLAVPALTSSPVPTAAEFEAAATCPNGNWTKATDTSTITLSSFTYTLTFDGFTSPYILITGP